MKRQSKSDSVVVECVENNDMDMEETFEKSVTFVDSRMIMVDDVVMK